ncbi:latrophilin receptor-like protein A isoform X1 [Centruroides vittatus]|uniref:latrophilin receptor-like protein A isoform X1 n=1 Tax=Centruroides vittatus TaxID=120091 RepID=UPI00350E8F34
MDLRIQLLMWTLLKTAALNNADDYGEVHNATGNSSDYAYDDEHVLETKMLADVCSRDILEKLNIIFEGNRSKQIYVESLSEGWSEEFLNCPHIALDSTEFCAIDNTTMYIAEYFTVYKATDYYTDGKVMFVCARKEMIEQSSTNEKFEIITNIGISLSNTCLGLHILAFVCIPEMRNLSGKNLFSLTIAVFFSFLFFIVSSNVKFRASCVIFAVLTYYFLISSFLWMSVIGFEIWRSLKTLRYETGFYAKNKELQRYLQYSVFGWATPVLLVLIILIIDNSPGVKGDFRPALGEKRCWFNSMTPFHIFFLTPLVLVMVSNLVFFIWSSYIICHTDKMSKDKRFNVLMKRCASYFRLFVVSGLTWISGIVHFVIQSTATAWIFVVFTSFYGIFVFISFTLTKKVLKKLKTKCPLLEKWLPSAGATSETEESKT